MINKTQYKILIAGCRGVGKPSFMNQFTENAFDNLSISSVEGYIYIVDITSKATLDAIDNFIEKVQKVKSSDHFPFVIFFNKMDLEDHEIKKEDIEESMKKFKNIVSKDVKYFIGSAKTKKNVDESIDIKSSMELIKKFHESKHSNR